MGGTPACKHFITLTRLVPVIQINGEQGQKYMEPLTLIFLHCTEGSHSSFLLRKILN